MILKPIHIVAIAGWVLVIFTTSIILSSSEPNSNADRFVDKERVNALEKKNNRLFKEIDILLDKNEELRGRDKEKEIIYKERIHNVYQTHDTNLVDSVRAVLTRYVRPTE